MSIKVGINGFGRIGRTILRLIDNCPGLEVVHINDLSDVATLAHLFKYDSVQGVFPGKIEIAGQGFKLNGRSIRCSQVGDPLEIAWGETGCQLVLECTGRFRDRAQAAGHLRDSVQKVVVSAPGKDSDVTIVMGVNEADYQSDRHQVISNASCTTNCLAPLAMILDEQLGLVHGYMTTIHSYTNDQRVLDGPHRDLRRARTAAMNQIPTTTGAARAIALVLPHLAGKLEGMSIRVPTPNVSLVDLVIEVERSCDPDTVNGFFRERANQGRFKGILDYSDEPLVSSDYNGSTFSTVIDALSTNVVGGRLVKVLAWYDNETGFSQRMVDLTHHIGKQLG